MNLMDKRKTFADQIRAAAPTGWHVYDDGESIAMPAVVIGFPGLVNYKHTTTHASVEFKIDLMVADDSRERAMREIYGGLEWVSEVLNNSILTAEGVQATSVNGTPALYIRINTASQVFAQ
jgi:hypothetical protein